MMKVLPAAFAFVLVNVGFSHGQSDLSPSSLGSAVPPRKFKLLIDYELGYAEQSTRNEVCVILNHQDRALYTKCEVPPARGQSGWSPRYPGTVTSGYDVIFDPYTGTDYYTICNQGSGDAFLVDKVIIQQERHGIDGDVTRVGPSFNWPFGPATDDGKGWCLSTRTDDWHDIYLDEKVTYYTCQQCLSVDFDGNWAWGRQKPYKCPSRSDKGWCTTCVAGADPILPASLTNLSLLPSPITGNGWHREGEDIVIQFFYPNNPGPDTRIALAPADSTPWQVSSSINWSYACSGTRSSTCASVRKCGTVTLGAATANDNTWPIMCGKWKVYLVPKVGHKPVAESKLFIIEENVCKKGLNELCYTDEECASGSCGCDLFCCYCKRKPEGNVPSAPVGPPSGISTSCEPEGNPAYLSILPSPTTGSTSHLPGEDITIEFSYPDNPGPDTWIALAPADSDPSAVPSPSINWSYTCSGTKSSTCTSVRKCGTVTLGAATAKVNKWPIPCGKWKAYLLPNGRYKSVAESEPFVIGNQECRRSEGRNSAEGNVAWGFETPKAKNLRGNEGNGQEVADA